MSRLRPVSVLTPTLNGNGIGEELADLDPGAHLARERAARKEGCLGPRRRDQLLQRHLYGVSKAALDHLARSWAVELAQEGVHVLTIDPGEMDTRMHAEAVPDADRAALARPGRLARRHGPATRSGARGGGGPDRLLAGMASPELLDRALAEAAGSQLHEFGDALLVLGRPPDRSRRRAA